MTSYVTGQQLSISQCRLLDTLQAGGALALEKLLAGEAEAAKPEFLKQRPKVETRSCCHVVTIPPWHACLEY